MTLNALALLTGLILTVHPTHEHQPLSELAIWDDGLSEMCYYDAVDQIYGKARRYTRVHMLNRQWMNAKTGVKTEADDAHAVAVFKLNIAEEIPTQNYNYRYLTTVFLQRPQLDPFKIASSSQEWCGTTFKHLRWNDAGLRYNSYSYFGGEGDQEWELPADVVPVDALFVLARDVVARGEPKKFKVLSSVRSTHQVEPTVYDAALVPAKTKKKKTAVGDIVLRRVELDWPGAKTFLDIEEAPPHRLIRFRFGQVEGTLKHVERRAYWDTNWSSEFHAPNQAP